MSDIRLFEMLSDYSSKNGYNAVQNIEDPFICVVYYMSLHSYVYICKCIYHIEMSEFVAPSFSFQAVLLTNCILSSYIASILMVICLIFIIRSRTLMVKEKIFHHRSFIFYFVIRFGGNKSSCYRATFLIKVYRQEHTIEKLE